MATNCYYYYWLMSQPPLIYRQKARASKTGQTVIAQCINKEES